jgi:hypothetical protein
MKIGIDIVAQRLPKGLEQMVLPKVRTTWEAALAMTCRDIAARGEVDHYGEPRLGLIVNWHGLDGAELAHDVPLPVTGLDLTIAKSEDDPDISAYLMVFSDKEKGTKRLAGSLIAQLHMDAVRRLNPGRPVMALEDSELEKITDFAFLNYPKVPLTAEYLVKHALQEFAYQEQIIRHDGESAHQRLERIAAQDERRQRRQSQAPA